MKKQAHGTTLQLHVQRESDCGFALLSATPLGTPPDTIEELKPQVRMCEKPAQESRTPGSGRRTVVHHVAQERVDEQGQQSRILKASTFLRCVLNNAQGFRQATLLNRTKATIPDGPQVGNTQSGQASSTPGKHFATNDRTKNPEA